MDPLALIKHFPFDEIFSSIKEFGLFYYRPKKYFSDFFKKDQKNQFRRTVVLLLLYSIIEFISYDDTTYKHQLFGILIDISIVIISCPINYLSLRITDCFKKNDVGFKEIIYFLIHSKFLISPIFLILHVFFINTEAYAFYYLTNILLIIQLYFFLFYLGFIFYKKAWKIVLFCFVSVLLYNIANASDIFFDIRTKGLGTRYSDVIYYEYNRAYNKYDVQFSKYPTAKILYVYPNNTMQMNLLLQNLGDTLSIGDIDSTLIYISKVKSSINSIDSLIPHLMYDKTIVGMKKWRNFLSSVLEYYETNSVMNDIRKYVIIRDSNKNRLCDKFIYKNTDRLVEKYCDAKLYEANFYKLNNNSKRVFVLYYPLAILPLIADNWKKEGKLPSLLSIQSLY